MNEKYTIQQSKIHGKGVFALKDFTPNAEIGVGIYSYPIPRVTPLIGAHINHSWTPNCFLKYYPSLGGYNINAKTDIQKGEELTLNYKNTPWYILGPNPNWK